VKRYWASHPLWKIAQWAYICGQRFDRFRRGQHPTRARYPVVCVGNFQAGGTGKTPATLWIAYALKELGYTPIILLRGYKGNIQSSELVTGHQAERYGDEALLHASHFPTVVGKNRVESSRIAESIASERSVFVLDDGLQHYPLFKDFNIVSQRSIRFENDTLLPHGRLREIPHERIDAVFTQFDESHPTPTSAWQHIPEYSFVRKTRLISGTMTPGLLVGGTANNASFFQAVQTQIDGAHKHLSFSDHHNYTSSDLQRIENAAKEMELRVHCTAKDAVKLTPLIESTQSPILLSVWDIELHPISNMQPLLDALEGKIKEVYAQRTSKGEQKA